MADAVSPDAPGLATRRVFVLGVSVALPVILGIIWAIGSWRSELERAEQDARVNVALVAQFVDRLVETQVILQKTAAQRIQSSTTTVIESLAFHRFLAGIDSAQANLYGVAVVDFDGNLHASSRAFPAQANFGQRDYIDGVASGDAIYIDRIRLDPSNDDAVVVATPFKVRSFDGLIVSAVQTESIASFLRDVATGRDRAASLMRTDGKLLLRNFPSEPVVLPPDSPGRVSIANRNSGVHRVVAVTDGIERIYAFQKIGDLPLYANFGMPIREVREAFLWKTIPVWALLAALGLASYLAMDRMRRSFQHRLVEELGRKRVREAEMLAEQRQHLMREMNHRVKNNLALVASMINMKMRNDPGYDGRDLQARIHAISEVHDLMYQAEDGTEIDAGEVLRNVVGNPAQLPEGLVPDIRIDVEPGIMVGPGLSTPLALIASEMVTNAVKHAFPQGGGTIRVRLHRAGEDVVLEVEDDGIGMGDAPRRRSGTAIIAALVRQLNGRLERLDGPGTRYRLTVPISPRRGEEANAG